MIMYRHPNSGRNQNIRIAYESFENVTKFRERLLSFSPKSFVFPSHIKKPED
jgi:hypothetical protein